MKPLITVIVPWRDTPLPDLLRAVLSIQNQSADVPIQTVVVDDASNPPDARAMERSLRRLQRPDRKITLVKLDTHSGIAAARNAGLAAGRGQFVSWLDSDDELDAPAILDLLRTAHTSTAPVIVGDCRVINSHSTTRRFSAPYLGALRQDMAGTIYDPWFTSVFAIQPQLIRSEVAVEVGGFRESYEWAEMTDFFLRIADHVGSDGIEHIPRPLYRYYRGLPQSHSANRSSLDKFRRMALVEQARRSGTKIERLHYIGRETTSGAQHYAPVVKGRVMWPPYLRSNTRGDLSSEQPLVLDAEYWPQDIRGPAGS